MKQRAFAQVDVFTDTPYLGNPVAVVLDGSGLSTEDMQAFTNWTNLSEVTFVLPPVHPEADYALRIFCPGRELLFAGHPTLGSCHSWLQACGVPQGVHVIQECGVGLVHIQKDGSRLAFVAPALRRSGPLPEDDVQMIEVRAFFPVNQGLTKDPVTGSLNAALGQWLIGAGLVPARYVARQGTALGRAGRVQVSQDAQGQVWVGGDCVVCVHGEVLL